MAARRPPDFARSASGPRVPSSSASASLPSSRHARVSSSQRVPPPPLLPPQVSEALAQLPPAAEWPALAFHATVIAPLAALARTIVALVVSPRTHRLVLRLGVLSAVVWAALALAVVAYVGFYRAWVPDIGHTFDVWLHYGAKGVPWAEFPMLPAQQGALLFARDQEYDVSLDLAVPLSAANLDLGNFMVSLDLLTASNISVHSVSRSAIITQVPAALRAIEAFTHTLTRADPLILPLSTNPTTILSLPLLRRQILVPAASSHPFTPRPDPVVRARVRVGREDAELYWKYGGGHGVGGVREGGTVVGVTDGFRSRGELQTTRVQLRIDAHLKGLRYFMFHHPVASFLLFTSLFMTFELVSALTLWALAALYTSSLGPGASLAVEDNYVDRERERTRRRRRQDSDEEATTPGGEATRSTQESRSTSSEADEQSASDETETETDVRARSLASLRARDEAERQEARRQEQLRDLAEGRRMAGVDEEVTGRRRVLDRLDEETEEDTDVGDSAGAGTWEEVDVEEEERMAGEEEEEDQEEQARRAGLRQRKGEPERESTVGGSATSRASSRSFTPSYAPSSSQATTSRASSSSASTIRGRSEEPSSSSSQAQPQRQEAAIKEEPEESAGSSTPSGASASSQRSDGGGEADVEQD